MPPQASPASPSTIRIIPTILFTMSPYLNLDDPKLAHPASEPGESNQSTADQGHGGGFRHSRRSLSVADIVRDGASLRSGVGYTARRVTHLSGSTVNRHRRKVAQVDSGRLTKEGRSGCV